MTDAPTRNQSGDSARARAAPLPEPAAEESRSANHHPAEDNEPHDEPRGGLLRRHPRAFALGLLAVAVVSACGYLYWDYAEHFESTDDAFIAARQFAVEPKISGYLTAVTVTDNQHVSAHDVIAHIDERDYRVALAQAEAQVAVAHAGMQ